MEKMRQWTVLTAVGVFAVLAAGWFLMVSPQRSHAADVRAEVASQETTNSQLQARLAQLEAQKKGLPGQQRLLDQIAAKIPATPELPALIRQLSTAAQAAGVDLVTLAPAQPAAVTVARPAKPVTPSTSGTSTTTGTTTGAPSVSTPAATPLLQIPVSVTVRGTYFNLNTFFRNVEKLTRAMLVPQFKITPATDTAGAPGEKAGPSDQLTATLSTIVFESPATTAPAKPLVPATTTAAQ
jgi:Tfp pilus assembly protein PilO